MAGFTEASLESVALDILVNELGFPASALSHVPVDAEGTPFMIDNPLKLIVQAIVKAVYRELTNAAYDNACPAADPP
jgi:hypothetical protein